MANTASFPGILNQDEFDQYAAQWLSVASAGEGPELAQAFLTGAAERVLALSFPLERIKWLVSAVGVRQIKARFLLLPDNGQPHFTLALFATDAEGERLSAYYLPDPYWTGSAASAAMGDPIPHDLASTWLANWKAAPAVTTALFATSTGLGPLRGYNFEVKDFVSALFAAQPFAGQNIYLGFGLHEFHAPASTDGSLTQTFGLVLQLAAPGQTTAAGLDDTFFDMAMPSPPNT